MSMIDDIKRDREAGTQGPWFVRTLENFGWNIVQYIGGDKHNISRVGKTNSETDARRIARVPDMEAALLAADELARALDAYNRAGAGPLTGWQDVQDALAAYRRATGGGE